MKKQTLEKLVRSNKFSKISLFEIKGGTAMTCYTQILTYENEICGGDGCWEYDMTVN